MLFGDDGDLDAAERMVDDWQAGFEERAERARELTTRLAALTVTARSRDGLVEVTLDTSGTVTGLRLDERVRQQSAARTAEGILAVFGAARTQLTRQVARVTGETLGAGSPTGQAIVASYTSRFGAHPDTDTTPDGGGRG